MAHRDVPATPAAGSKREADKLGAGRVKAGRFSVEGKGRGRLQLGDKFIEIGQSQDAAVTAAVAPFGTGKGTEEFVKFELLEDFGEGRAVRFARRQRFQVVSDRQVIDEGDELAAEARLFGKVFEIFAFLPLELVGVGEEILDRPELLNQLDCGLFADAGDTGDIIRRVAGQGLYLNDAGRRAAEAFGDLGKAGDLLLHGVKETHLRSDGLHQILVAGDDCYFQFIAGKALRQSGNQIIRFKTGLFEDRQIKGSNDLLDFGDLRHQIIRHRNSVRLVLRIKLFAESRSARIEDDRQVVGLLVADDLEEHGGKAIDSVGRKALAVGKMADGVISTVDVARTVDEIKAFALVRHEGPREN